MGRRWCCATWRPTTTPGPKRCTVWAGLGSWAGVARLGWHIGGAEVWGFGGLGVWGFGGLGVWGFGRLQLAGLGLMGLAVWRGWRARMPPQLPELGLRVGGLGLGGFSSSGNQEQPAKESWARPTFAATVWANVGVEEFGSRISHAR